MPEWKLNAWRKPGHWYDRTIVRVLARIGYEESNPRARMVDHEVLDSVDGCPVRLTYEVENGDAVRFAEYVQKFPVDNPDTV